MLTHGTHLLQDKTESPKHDANSADEHKLLGNPYDGVGALTPQGRAEEGKEEGGGGADRVQQTFVPVKPSSNLKNFLHENFRTSGALTWDLGGADWAHDHPRWPVSKACPEIVWTSVCVGWRLPVGRRERAECAWAFR